MKVLLNPVLMKVLLWEIMLLLLFLRRLSLELLLAGTLQLKTRIAAIVIVGASVPAS